MALSEQVVLEALHDIRMAGGGPSLVEAGAVRNIQVEGSSVRVLLEVEASQPGANDALRAAVDERLSELEGVESVEVRVQASLPMAPAAATAPPPPSWAGLIPGVERVIAVASGKGGVGKSTVAANIALALASAGHSAGLLDADIYGPSQQLMMGSSDDPMGDAEGKIHPVEAPGGVKVMSFGYIVDADQPVIWRGPMLQKALEQFFGDVLWGDLDYLVVDLPPGTGDVALTLCQNVPMAGAIIVTTPQDMALIDVRKSLNMFRKLGVTVLGIIENMSHYQCPQCGHVAHIFGDGGGRRTADSLEVPFLGAIPLDAGIVTGGDAGTPVVIDRPDSVAAKAFSELAGALADKLET